MKNLIKKILIFVGFSTMIFACNNIDNQSITQNDSSDTLIYKAKNLTSTYPDSSINICKNILKTNLDGNPLVEINCINLIGTSYEVKGNYDSAGIYLYKALQQIDTHIKDTILLGQNLKKYKLLKSSILVNIGILQFNLKKEEKAIETYQRAKKIAEECNDTISIIHINNNIGNTYMTISGNMDSAIVYLEKTMKLSKESGYHLGYKTAGMNLAQIYNYLGQNQKAHKLIKDLVENYGANIYTDFTEAHIYNALGKQNEALIIFKNLLTQKLNNREFELAIINDIANIYKDQKQLDSTLVYLQKHTTLKDSIHDIEIENKISQLEIQYETQTKDLKIENLNQRNRLYVFYGISIITVIIIILIYLIFNYLLLKKRKQFAEEKVKKLEQEKQLIATQAVLDGETTERIRLARDLHDGLGGLLSSVKRNLNDMNINVILKQQELQNFDHALRLLDDSIKELRRVAHHLMPESLSRFGLKTALSDFCKTISIVNFSFFGTDARLDSKIEITLYRVVHELINNALKHSEAKNILVQIMQEPSRIAITVEDNGKGFDTTLVNKGMGLQNIKDRIIFIGGTINLYSVLDEGSEINVEIILKP